MKKFKDIKRTDKWYKDKPEWGTPESTKKAKKITPGEDCKEDLGTVAMAGLAALSAAQETGRRKDGSEPFRKAAAARKKRAENSKTRIGRLKNRFTKKVAHEEVAANSTVAMPDPKVTVQGEKKKRKFATLTKRYIEIGGKRKLQVR